MTKFTKDWLSGWRVLLLLSLCAAVVGAMSVVALFLLTKSRFLAYLFVATVGVFVLPIVFHWLFVRLFGEEKRSKRRSST
jgi:FtsH-binding integral membrane protein